MTNDDTVTNQDGGQQIPEQEVRDIPSEDTQEAPMPSAEDQQMSPEPEEDGSDLPEEVSERTKKNFDKLKESNSELKRELEDLRKQMDIGSATDFLYGSQNQQGYQSPSADNYQNLNQSQVNNIAQGFVDAQGNVDIVALNRALQEANQRATNAERLAQQGYRERQTQMVDETLKKNPWLDPNSPEDFDPKGFKLWDNIRRGYEASGRARSYDQIAAEVLEYYTPKTVAQESKQTANQTKKTQAASVGKSSNANAREDNETRLRKLREASRKGDVSALDARIAAATS